MNLGFSFFLIHKKLVGTSGGIDSGYISEDLKNSTSSNDRGNDGMKNPSTSKYNENVENVAFNEQSLVASTPTSEKHKTKAELSEFLHFDNDVEIEIPETMDITDEEIEELVGGKLDLNTKMVEKINVNCNTEENESDGSSDGSVEVEMNNKNEESSSSSSEEETKNQVQPKKNADKKRETCKKMREDEDDNIEMIEEKKDENQSDDEEAMSKVQSKKSVKFTLSCIICGESTPHKSGFFKPTKIQQIKNIKSASNMRCDNKFDGLDENDAEEITLHRKCYRAYINKVSILKYKRDSGSTNKAPLVKVTKRSHEPIAIRTLMEHVLNYVRRKGKLTGVKLSEATKSFDNFKPLNIIQLNQLLKQLKDNGVQVDKTKRNRLNPVLSYKN